MSRYRWPSAGASGDRALRRFEHRSRAAGLMPTGASEAVRALRQTPSRRGRLVPPGGPLGAPSGDADLWVPIGPSVVLNGQAGSRPRVAGRVRDLAVSADGRRAYAATANGGVWYSGDGGSTWSPLGNWNLTPGGSNMPRPATVLTCGCLLVTFGAAADGSGDEVLVGTGELIPRRQGSPGGRLGGVGVLRLRDPLPVVLANPFGNPWEREANNLAGAGIFRMARDPADPQRILAATSIGLFTRVGTFVENADWTKVTLSPFNFEADDDERVTDVLWTSPPSRLWVALQDSTFNSDSGVWMSENGVAGPFTKVSLSGLDTDGRLGLARAPSDPTIVYVLGKGAKMWRINATTAAKVLDLPRKLFGEGERDQSYYDLAIAVHPDDPEVVFVGGSTIQADGQWSASLFRCRVMALSGGLFVSFLDSNQEHPENDASFIGNGVHADVHAVRLAKDGADVHVWVGCDGGVFRSRRGGDRHTFVACNTGLAVLECGYVASHPDNDCVVLAGTQDNGLLRRVGDTVWQYSDVVGGDGGGVAFHPVEGRYYAAQYTSAHWRSNGRLSPPVWRRSTSTTTVSAEDEESKRSMFYSGIALRRVGATDQVRLAVGTDRLWLVDNWQPAPPPPAAGPPVAPAPTSWVVLPSGRDPRTGTSEDTCTDRLDGGAVIACRWMSDLRLIVLCQRGVYLFRRKPDGTWFRKKISQHTTKCVSYKNGDISKPSEYLPPLGAWSDLAIHDTQRGADGSFYVATTGSARLDGDRLVEDTMMDTLWWYDGSRLWHATNLRDADAPPNVGTKAPAYAVVCDPDDPSIVYVGTALGVWRGTLSFGAGGAPSWQWRMFSNGLPEAAVQDLSFFPPYPPDLPRAPLATKVLRAAVQARGVWEVDLSPSAPTPRRTFVRVHQTDARRPGGTSLTNPLDFGYFPWNWHASPDVRIRPAPLQAGEAIPSPPAAGPLRLPWAGAAPDPHLLWTFQTALHRIDPLCRANGLWTPQFEARLRAHNPAGGNTIDAARWAAVVTADNVYRPPWDGAEPTEADLFELVVEPRDAAGNTYTGGIVPAVPRVERRRHLIDVLVHHRDLRPVAAADVRVALLARELTTSASTWHALAIAPAWKDRVAELMSPPVPAGWALPDSWRVADSGSATRQPSAAVDARLPRAVTFEVDFATVTPGTHLLLLAVVHSTPDPVTPAKLFGSALQDLVLSTRHVAARVVFPI